MLTATLLRRQRLRARRVRSEQRSEKATPAGPREAAAASAREWEVRLHEAGRAAEASLTTRAAGLRALTDAADNAADRLRAFPAADGGVPADLPAGDAAAWRHLRQAGYDEAQIAVLLARDPAAGADGARRAA